MKVSEVKTGNPFFCQRETDLGAATELLWNGNCGFLPVVADNGQVVGAVTDRDICIALGTKDRRAGEVTVAEIVSNRLATCTPDDDIHDALATMSSSKVHRLAVIGPKRELVGVLSVDDVMAKAIHTQKADGVTTTELADSLKKIVSNQVTPPARPIEVRHPREPKAPPRRTRA